MAHTKVTKTHSQNTGVANTYSYSGSFNVFKATEVVVTLDGVALTYTASTINESASPREYTVDTSAKTIHIGGADLSSGSIVMRPQTDMGAPTPRATYTPGASITSEDLNNNQTQLMRKAMEYDETKMSSTGDTMTGNLTIGEDATIIFEGATDDGYETTLTVTDPTADRTITLPNVTGTVVTTGDTATVTATMLAANSVDSSELVDGSIDTSHIANLQVTTDKIAADAVTGAKIADDAINSEHYTDGSIDHVHLANDAVDGDNIANDSINSEHYVDGSIDTAHIADDQVTAAKLAHTAVTAGSYTAADITVDAQGRLTSASSGTISTSEIAADAITGAKIADDAINSEHYTDASIDTAHIADGQVTADKVASNAVTTAKITDSNVTTAKIADDAITIAKVGCEQTTISDSDSHIPTSGAVVDYVAAQIAPIGGLEVIADDESFPNTIPAAGVVISITDASGLQINSSGVSTNGDTLDNSTVTINGFPSSLRGGVGNNADPYVLGSGAGLMVQSTGSSQTYNYHKALLKESDFVQLSDDINDFNSKYRIASSAPGSDNDEGDLYFNTSTNKMYVYDGSAWGEVTSTGDYKFLTIKDHDQAVGGSGPTFNGSNEEFDLFDGSSDASITSAAQLLVVLNGVLQKPNSGTFSGSEEGYYLNDTHGIKFCDPPASGSTLFVTQLGTATTVNVPADGSVTAAKIGSGAVTTAKIADANVTTAKLASDAVTTAKITDANVTTAKLASDAVTGAKIADDAIDSEHYTDGSIDTAHIAADAVTAAKIADDAVGAEHIEQLDADLSFADSVKASFGAGGDFTIEHNGSTTILDSVGNQALIVRAGTGDLYLQSDGTVYIGDDGGNEYSAKFIDNGAVELYNDNTKEFSTKSGGVKLWGCSESIITDLTWNSATTVTIDMSQSNHFNAALSANITVGDPSNEQPGQSGAIFITQDGTGSRTASWHSSWKWVGGTAPTLSTAANAVDRIDYIVKAIGTIHAVASLDVK